MAIGNGMDRVRVMMANQKDSQLFKAFAADITRAGHLANTEARGINTRALRRVMLATVGLSETDTDAIFRGK